MRLFPFPKLQITLNSRRLAITDAIETAKTYLNDRVPDASEIGTNAGIGQKYLMGTGLRGEG